MIRQFRRPFMAALALLPALASQPAAAATIEVRPQGDYVAKGNLVDIDVIARLDAGERIGSYGIAVIWQAAWLSFNSLSIDQFLGGPDNSTQLSASGLSSVIVSETALAGTDAQAGLSEFRLFRFSLLVTAMGVSPLEVGSVQLFDEGGATLPVVILNSSLTTVPVPGAMLLLGSALAVAGAGMRRRVG